MSPAIEVLEDRMVPVAIVSLTAGTLLVQGDNDPNVVTMQLNPDIPAQIQLNVDGRLTTYPTASVQQIAVLGAGGNDILTVNVPAVMAFLMGGVGNDNLWSFGSDVLSGGAGNDTLYSIVGTSAMEGGAGRDRMIGNTRSIFSNDNADRPNIVFGSTTQPVQLLNGILYFLGTNSNDQALLTRQGNQLVVNYNGQRSTFDRNAVDQVVGVFGGGDDMVVNYSSTDSVFYGASGNDVLVGGSGDDILKGGSGNDFLWGSDGRDDLTGDAGNDLLVGSGMDLLRIDAADVFNAERNDMVISILGGMSGG